MRLFIVFTVLLLGSVGFCQEVGVVDWVPVDPSFVLPSWLETALLWVGKLPAVGPILVQIEKWVSIVAVVSTNLVVAIIGSVKAVSAGLRAAGFSAQADSLEKFAATVVYGLKYVSVFNAKK